MTLKLSDPNIAVKGTYTIDAVFSAPGPNKVSLGLELTVFDICDSSLFPSAPVLSMSTY